jgi:aryl carrier-like protein
VRQNVVWPWTEGGHKRLAAYVIVNEERAGDLGPLAAELRETLRQRLPEYMIPSAFVWLDALPLNANGKVERKLLLPPDQAARAVAAAEYVAPRTQAEELLARVWAEVLSVERVGVHDNFFELGGDSILSLQIIARARQAGLALTPRQLFEAPTVAGLALVAQPLAVWSESTLSESAAAASAPSPADFGWSQEDVQDILGEIDKLG